MSSDKQVPFSARLVNWLTQQPEWPLILGTDRADRRRAARMVSRLVMTIPPAAPGPLNRRLRRALKKGLRVTASATLEAEAPAKS